MPMIDFQDSTRIAFTRGIWKGMAAPFMLFAHTTAPALPTIEPIHLPDSAANPFGVDWGKIAGDMHAAIGRHEQASTRPGSESNHR